MKAHRRIFFAVAATFPLLAHAACATNGDAIPIPNQVYDAQALDAASNPFDLDGGNEHEASIKKDAEPSDAAAEADAPVVVTGLVQISEIYVDTVLRGDGTEYVELRAQPGTPVDDLKLRLLYSDGQVKYELTAGDPGQKFPASGLWVVGGGQTFKLNVLDHVDKTVGLNSWGLDTRGAVQLVRGTKLLDVVGYGEDPDAGPVAAPASPPTATVEGSPARVPVQPSSSGAKAKSFGRKIGAADTNDNAADFCTMEATPGYLQKACE